MRRLRWGWVILGVAVVATMALTLRASGRSAGPSTVSTAAGGYLGARRVLEEMGADVELLTVPLADQALDGPLVVAFPWRLADYSADLEDLADFVEEGGVLVYAYGGLTGLTEPSLASRFNLEVEGARDPAPLGPRAWWDYQVRSWKLEPEGSLEGLAPAEIAAPTLALVPPRGARVLYRFAPATEESPVELGHGQPAIFELEYGEGRVVVLPAAALSNAHLGSAGNADLLATLFEWLGPSWTFDEYHHGLVSPDAVIPEREGNVPRGAFDLFAVHLVVIYALAVLAMGAALRAVLARAGRPHRIGADVPRGARCAPRAPRAPRARPPSCCSSGRRSSSPGSTWRIWMRPR